LSENIAAGWGMHS